VHLSDELSRLLARTHDFNVVPGIAVALVDEGGIVGQAGSGVASMQDGSRVTPDTAFLWFSMTKIVSATVAMRLEKQGHLDLDAPIREYTGDLVPGAIGGRVSSRHLLSHTSGLPNPMPLRWVHSATDRTPDLREFVLKAARRRRLKSEPGERAAYTNLGYLILGLVLEIAGRAPYESLARDHVLDPLGMTRTSFAYPGSDVALGHHRAGRAARPLVRAIVPRSIGLRRSDAFLQLDPFYVDGPSYGGLVGSAIDAARFVHAHITGSILAPESLKAMQTIRNRGKRLDTGLGWFRTKHAATTYGDAVEHLGGGLGFYNVMRLDRDRRAGVVVMGNATRHDLDSVADLALQLVRT
jgi:CubicO group peptidase (beta-lactamase class C family)